VGAERDTVGEGGMTVASRRGFLAGSAGLLSAAATLRPASAEVLQPATEAFYGTHQAGITTRQQAHTYFAAFDLSAETRDDVRALLKVWTQAAANLAAGAAADKTDSGEDVGMPAAHLTITFGIGPGLFIKDGKDRYGLAAKRPQALVDLPVFVGDQLQPARCGGDLSVQACADDPQTAFHAVRQLARLAYGKAQLRWAQSGFVPALVGQTPRNLMGFKDGSNNPDASNPADMAAVVWVGDEGPAWMRGGSYVVPRRIRIALEHWDRTPVAFQEQTVGRSKANGAPVGGKAERDQPDLAANDADGNPVIAENAHVRLASASASGTRILRRGYSYNDGLSFTAERWPPWHQGMEYDSGLLFVAYQKDPRTGFIKMFDKMAKFDMMNQFVTHVGSAIFACPPGCAQGGFLGEALFT
jgi:deferrochelatase/peroxidase EfeB